MNTLLDKLSITGIVSSERLVGFNIQHSSDDNCGGGFGECGNCGSDCQTDCNCQCGTGDR